MIKLNTINKYKVNIKNNENLFINKISWIILRLL